MNEYAHLAAYWGPRAESAGACAQRTSRFLEALAVADPLFSSWFRKGRSAKDAMKHPVTSEEQGLEALLQRGVNRRDTDRSVMTELGYSMDIWTGGKSSDAASLSIACGITSPRLSNAVVLKLPRREWSRDVMLSVVRAAASAWDPRVVKVVSDEFHRLSGVASEEDAPSWITYLSKAVGVPPLPTDVTRLEEENGTVIIAAADFSSASPRDVAAARKVMRLLGQRGA